MKKKKKLRFQKFWEGAGQGGQIATNKQTAGCLVKNVLKNLSPPTNAQGEKRRIGKRVSPHTGATGNKVSTGSNKLPPLMPFPGLQVRVRDRPGIKPPP